jgi:hypothetical protein
MEAVMMACGNHELTTINDIVINHKFLNLQKWIERNINTIHPQWVKIYLLILNNNNHLSDHFSTSNSITILEIHSYMGGI